jgi:ribokinase
VVCGRVGDDEFGRRFLSALDEEGIDRRAVVVDGEAGTGVATIYVEPDGTNTIVQAPRANLQTTAADIDSAAELLLGADMAMTQRELSAEGTLRFLELMHGRTPTMFNTAPAGHIRGSLLRLSDIVVANQIEATQLTGLPTDDGAACLAACRTMVERGHRMAVITMGEGGSVAATADAAVEQEAFEIAAVDTTGAGDAFCGALAVRLAEGAGLADAMRFTNAAGALACTKHGAYPSMPYRAKVEELMAGQGSSS